MTDQLKYATISQIYTKDLKCYEEEKTKRLADFCNSHGISFLPSKNRKGCYEYHKDTGTFTLKLLKDVPTLKPTSGIFDKDTLKVFDIDSDNVVFVVQDNCIVGVVHIVDYQREFIYVELYRLLFRYESKVRELLTLNNETNESFLNYIEEQAEIEYGKGKLGHFSKRKNEYVGRNEAEQEKKKLERNLMSPFQSFYFKDLVEFWNSKNILNKIFRFSDVNEINSLRNWVAHSKDIVKQEKNTDEVKLYNYQGLVTFVNNVNCFLKSYDALEMIYKKVKEETKEGVYLA